MHHPFYTGRFHVLLELHNGHFDGGGNPLAASKARSASQETRLWRAVKEATPAVVVEGLEERRLFAVGYFVTSGTLIVYGDGGSENLKVTDLGGTFSVNINSGAVTGSVSGISSIVMRGYGGDDEITVAGGTAVPLLAYGGDGNDTLFGTDVNDVLWGENGSDTIHGYSGNDLIYGGYGNDHIYLGDGSDSAYGGADNDTFEELPDGAVDYIDGEGGTDAIGPDGRDIYDSYYNIENP